tara:strand:- start:541 stop:1107 length:567 start_codon:yes stop_codon:yes gene_type:complete
MNLIYDKITSQSCSIIEVDNLSFSFSMDDLHLIIKSNVFNHNMGALMTEWVFKHDYFKEIENTFSNIIKQLPSASYEGANASNPRFDNLTAHCNHDDRLTLELSSIWGQIYGKGAYQVSHTHLPSHWSFVLFVNCPEGSSPLIFGDNDLKVHPRPNYGVVFPGWVRHYVPKNFGVERSVVSGNFYYSK